MSEFVVKHLASGGVITNYHCVSRCGHCLYNCGPHRPKDFLDAALAERIFSTILQYGCRSVHIGGGEPLLQPGKLEAVLEAARTAGMGIDYVETSSAWFVDSEKALSLLDGLKRAGLRTLLVSISPFHNAAIPYSRVMGVINACRRSGIDVFPWVNGFVRDLSRLDVNRPHGMAEFEAVFGPDYLKRIPGRYWIHLGGRALGTFRPVFPQHPLEHILENSPLSCVRALGDTSHFHIDPYGNYIPGLCSGLAIAMEDLGSPITAGDYPLLHRLATTGIRGLYRMAVQEYRYVPQRSAYLNHCDVCNEIRCVLARADSGRFRELAPEGHYMDPRQSYRPVEGRLP
jgi:hypothetical protein